MKERTFRVVTWVVLLAIVAAGMPAGAQTTTGELVGQVMDPDGNPAAGFKLVFQAVGGDLDLVTAPSDASGRYGIELPAGIRYNLIAAIAPDGSRMEVPPLPPIPVEPGARRLDVQFHYPSAPTEAAAAGAAAGDTTTPTAKKGKKNKALWWQIGAATAVTLFFGATVFNKDDKEDGVSPYRP